MGGGDLEQSLMTSLVARVSGLESARRRMQVELVKKEKEVLQLRAQVRGKESGVLGCCGQDNRVKTDQSVLLLRAQG